MRATERMPFYAAVAELGDWFGEHYRNIARVMHKFREVEEVVDWSFFVAECKMRRSEYCDWRHIECAMEEYVERSRRPSRFPDNSFYCYV